MEMKKVEIAVPEKMLSYLLITDGEAQLKRNAMLLYPYVYDCTISYGKAAEILGVHKSDLIALYGKMGIPYIQELPEEFETDIDTIKKIRVRMSNGGGES